jgi:hypothetical protein
VNLIMYLLDIQLSRTRIEVSERERGSNEASLEGIFSGKNIQMKKYRFPKYVLWLDTLVTL